VKNETDLNVDDNNIDAATNHIDADNMNSALSRYNLIYLIL
jgi:hypothetical protein